MDPPIRIAAIDLAVLMSVTNYLLDLKPTQASVAQSKLSVVGPNEVLDLHGGRAYAGARLDDPCSKMAETRITSGFQ